MTFYVYNCNFGEFLNSEQNFLHFAHFNVNSEIFKCVHSIAGAIEPDWGVRTRIFQRILAEEYSKVPDPLSMTYDLIIHQVPSGA